MLVKSNVIRTEHSEYSHIHLFTAIQFQMTCEEALSIQRPAIHIARGDFRHHPDDKCLHWST